VALRQRSRRSTHSTFVNKLSTDLSLPSKTDIATCNQFSSRQHFSTFYVFNKKCFLGVRQRSRRSTKMHSKLKIATGLNSLSKTDRATCNQFSNRQHFLTFRISNKIWFLYQALLLFHIFSKTPN